MQPPLAPSLRLARLERDNARLRALLSILRRRFATAFPGGYLVLDDGDLDGPHADVLQAARDCAADGLACTVVTVGARYEADADQDNFTVPA